jgi:TRAP-type transport system small permease protein
VGSSLLPHDRGISRVVLAERGSSVAKWIDRILEDFTIVLFSILCVVVFAAVVARYVFQNPLMWSEEVVIYLFTWVVFLGSTILYKDKKHISIGIVTSMLPRTVRNILDIFGELLILAFLLLLLHQGSILFQMNADIPSITIPVPVGIATVSLPVMALLMIYYNIRHMIEKFKNNFSVPETESEAFKL